MTNGISQFLGFGRGLPSAYRASVADINAALQGSNIEAARAALRSLLGDIPVFQIGRHLAARVTINQGALMRNPGAVLLVGSGGRIPSLLSVIPRLQARRYPRAAAQSAQQP
jgi:hypothetical protein